MPRAPSPPDDDARTLVQARSESGASAGVRGSGVSIARFVLERELGKGGMAVVYRARDTETGVDVALKRLTGNLDRATRARFAREVRAASMVAHENICRVVAVGEDDGRPFLAMELVPGETLADLARRGPDVVPARVAAALFAQLLDALAAAHAAGVLHRDLKPANVMVTSAGVLKLVDFGIAKSVDDETVTKTGALVGTPVYMAPEQVRLEPVDGRIDLFAAGLSLQAFLKKGRHRFYGRKLDPTQMLIRVALEPTVPLLEDVPSAPVSLDNIVAGLTALDVERRFTDAISARTALQETGLVPADGRALVARYVRDPHAVAAAENVIHARVEGDFARAVAVRAGGAPAASLALERAALLDPRGPWQRELDALVSQHHIVRASLDEERAHNPKVDALAEEIGADPQAPALLRRMSELMRARGNVRLHAAYLWRTVRERPDDELALRQLRVLLEGPVADGVEQSAEENVEESAAPRSAVRLSTQSIVAGIRTGGLKAVAPARAARRDATARLLQPERSATATRSSARAPATAPAADATVVLVSEAAAQGSAPGRRVVGALVVAAVLIAGAALIESLRGVGGRAPVPAAADARALLKEAEAVLADDPARAEALATDVLLTSPAARDGLDALWVRARSHRARGNVDEARADCDLYLARATDFHDPHLLEVKKLLAGLGARP